MSLFRGADVDLYYLDVKKRVGSVVGHLSAYPKLPGLIPHSVSYQQHTRGMDNKDAYFGQIVL